MKNLSSEQLDGATELVSLTAEIMRQMHAWDGPEFGGASVGEMLRDASSMACYLYDNKPDTADAVSTQDVAEDYMIINEGDDRPIAVPSVSLGFLRYHRRTERKR